MRFKGLDLNLLVAFDALMETCNTAHAGARLGLSQPAASAALARLRDYFQDELLVLNGRRMYPTPLAEMLLPRIKACLAEAAVVVATSSQFDPGSAERQFRIISSDYVAAAILAPLVQQTSSSAPGVRFHFMLADETAPDQLRRGEIDLLIAPAEHAVRNVPTELLYEERYVVAGWSEHPLFAAPITEDALFAYGHIAVTVGRLHDATVGDRQLELLGRRRVVEVTASSFAVLPWLLIGTQRLTLMHERLARLAARHCPIRYAPLPFPFAPLKELAQFHETRASEQGVRWLIDQIRRQAALLDEPSADQVATASAIGSRRMV